MPGRGDEVEQSMNTVVAEAGVTLDTGLLSENVIELAFQVPNDLLEAGKGEPRNGALRKINLTQTRCRCYLQSRVCRQSSGQCGRLPPPILHPRSLN